MSVQSLAEICCNFIAASTNDSGLLASGKKGFTRRQRLALLEHTLDYALPDKLVKYILSKLPIDESLILQEKFPQLSNLFEEMWELMCRTCLSFTLPETFKDSAFMLPELYRKYGRSEISLAMDDVAQSHRQNFINAYLSDLVHTHEIHANYAKRIKTDQCIVEEFGARRRGISGELMICMLLQETTKIFLNTDELVDTLYTVIRNHDIVVKNVKKLVIHTQRFSYGRGNLMNLIKLISGMSPVRTIKVMIHETDNFDHLLVKGLMGFIASLDSKQHKSSRLGEAAISPEIQDDAHDNVDNEQQCIPENVRQITNFEMCFDNAEPGSVHDVPISRRLPIDFIDHWYCLEVLSVSLNNRCYLTTSLCTGIAILLSNNRAKLKYVRIRDGCFDVSTFRHLGYSLNSTEVDKSIAFELCNFLYFSSDVKDQEFVKLCPEPTFSSIKVASVVRCGRHCPTANVVIITSELLRHFNPRKLYVHGKNFDAYCRSVHDSTVLLFPDDIRLVSIILKLNDLALNDVLAMLWNNAFYNGKNFDVHVISSIFSPSEYENAFKSITVTKLDECDLNPSIVSFWDQS